MIEEIAELVFDLFRIRILGCDYDFCCLFSYLFQNLVDPLVKQVVSIGTFLRIMLPV